MVGDAMTDRETIQALIDQGYDARRRIFRQLPSLIEVEQAAKAQALKIWDECPTGDIAITIALGDKTATDAAFAQTKHVVSVRLVNNRNYSEPDRTALCDRHM
jgi:hypothetical protein